MQLTITNKIFTNCLIISFRDIRNNIIVVEVALVFVEAVEVAKAVVVTVVEVKVAVGVIAVHLLP